MKLIKNAMQNSKKLSEVMTLEVFEQVTPGDVIE